jgi:PKD repeat protein
MISYFVTDRSWDEIWQMAIHNENFHSKTYTNKGNSFVSLTIVEYKSNWFKSKPNYCVYSRLIKTNWNIQLVWSI